MQFLKSTDDTNIDTTTEYCSSSLNSSAVSNDKSATSFSEYDATKFLENAIGGVTSQSTQLDMTVEEAKTKKSDSKIQDSSIGPSDVSSLISRASDLYSSMKKSIRRNSMKVCSTQEDHKSARERNRLSTVSVNNTLVDKLMRELTIQNEIMFQVSKALNYCKTFKGFETTIEFIEAEKILLIAYCTKEALMKEIGNIDDETYERKEDLRSCGQISLSNFSFLSKEGYKNVSKEITEHFVLILSSGSTVMASEVILADEIGGVQVEKKFEFDKLAPDFEIIISIYAMRVRSKFHNQDQGNCPSPKKFFLNKVSKKYKVTNNSYYIKPSSFFLWGKCEIRSSDLSKIQSRIDNNTSLTLKMNNTPLGSSLSGMFSVNISSNVKLFNRTSGFLTIGLDNEHGCTIWNRRWCLLEGTILKYWNYPSEEVTSALGTLDLNSCLDNQVATVDRSLCARPRTLVVTVKYKDGERKYLLSADNLSDMKQWEAELNYVIRILHLWRS